MCIAIDALFLAVRCKLGPLCAHSHVVFLFIFSFLYSVQAIPTSMLCFYSSVPFCVPSIHLFLLVFRTGYTQTRAPLCPPTWCITIHFYVCIVFHTGYTRGARGGCMLYFFSSIPLCIPYSSFLCCFPYRLFTMLYFD